MCFLRMETLANYCFGTCGTRKTFPDYIPSDLMGIKFLPGRGAPHRGPGLYMAEDKYSFVYNLSKIPTSKKGYAFGARTSPRFQPIYKVSSIYPGMYQKIQDPEEKHKQSFVSFNTMAPRFRRMDLGGDFPPGPGTYNVEMKPPKKVAWPMKFGSPDWAQVPCPQKKTLRAELTTDKDFRKHRNRVAYLSLYYN
ncbi:protein pitchfork [Echinops telfairi]|uniref:Protein pitchfork n=1 Tax=Echinops telfairi TaxID=9371 RepID=A0AC55D8Q4_ECHTE|nr:protein pitchfork [Echinops telfairi]